MDCNWINNRLLVGAIIENEADAVFLKHGGITHVINCMRCNDEEPWVRRFGMSYLYNALEDDGKPKPVEWFKTTIEWALPVLVHPRNKLYVHCRGGQQRGPSNAYAILRALGMTSEQAEKAIQKVRKCGLGYKKDADLAIEALGY